MLLGWFADLFRLVWGLPYWNIRKSWFRLRRGRARCPCQNPSDSGRGFDTTCEACIQWDRPARFRRVCPLLVETKDGLRCSADTADVRPFWGRMFGYYGGTLLAFYLAGAVVVFVFLRTIGYPVSIVHVTWPGLWYRVPQARGWFFADKSQRAFATGQTSEGLLYLTNAYEFDPLNYGLGLALAKSYQSGQPHASDQLFERLLRENPAQRNTTLQEWFRALLARGDFEKIAGIAHAEILADPAHAHGWIRALLFVSRQTGNDEMLRALLASNAPAARPWHQLLETELLVRAGRTHEAHAALVGQWPAAAPAFTFYYQVSTLSALGDHFAALDLLAGQPGRFDDEAAVTLRLEAYAAGGFTRPLQAEIDKLLASKLNLANLARIKILCAHLIRWPDAEVFGRLADKVQRDQTPLNTETAGVWFSLLCTAGVVGDAPRLHGFVLMLKQTASTPFVALDVVEAYFRGEAAVERITTLLPALPLPTEIYYALIERYPGPPRPVAAGAK